MGGPGSGGARPGAGRRRKGKRNDRDVKPANLPSPPPSQPPPSQPAGALAEHDATSAEDIEALYAGGVRDALLDPMRALEASQEFIIRAEIAMLEGRISERRFLALIASRGRAAAILLPSQKARRARLASEAVKGLKEMQKGRLAQRDVGPPKDDLERGVGER